MSTKQELKSIEDSIGIEWFTPGANKVFDETAINDIQIKVFIVSTARDLLTGLIEIITTENAPTQLPTRRILMTTPEAAIFVAKCLIADFNGTDITKRAFVEGIVQEQ